MTLPRPHRRLPHKIDDFIDPTFDFSGGFPATLQYRNISRAVLEGVELEAMYDAKAWFVGVAAHRIRGTNEDTGEGLYSVPADAERVSAWRSGSATRPERKLRDKDTVGSSSRGLLVVLGRSGRCHIAGCIPVAQQVSVQRTGNEGGANVHRHEPVQGSERLHGGFRERVVQPGKLSA